MGQCLRFIWKWPLWWFALLAICSGVGAIALQRLLTMPPQTDCETLSANSLDGDHLYCANAAAKSGELEKLIAAIDLVEGWPEDHPLRGQAQSLMGEWAKMMVDIADKKFNGGDRSEAMEIVAKIPEKSPGYERLMNKVATWEGDWDRGKDIYNDAQYALKNKSWSEANKHARELLLVDNAYWRTVRYGKLKEQIDREEKAWKKLESARYYASWGRVEDLVYSIDEARQIDPSTYTKAEAEKDVTKWSQQLLDMAQKQWKNGDMKKAIAAANWIPPDLSIQSEAENLKTVMQAVALVENDSPTADPTERLFSFWQAQASLGKIDSESQIYEQAQELQASWEEQIQDLVQLQMANLTASFAHPVALKLAIDQAEMIEMDRPRRIQAQTLIAEWRKEIQKIEDRSYLAQARSLASSETIEGYKAAIALASKVELGRPLRIEGQTLIAEWKKRVETIEDKPILEKARSLAKEGNLKEAVETAEKIGPGRALYEEAGNEISKWVAKIQIAEDRPILDEATSLAARGLLQDAIDTAYQIGSGRALYSEAQDAIYRWEAQLSAIRAREAAAQRAAYERQTTTYYQQSEPFYTPPEPVYTPPAPAYIPPPAYIAPPAYTPPE
ncbi:MAG: hypothetical protein F6J93_26065 [Oscillatoria sp. SIO1A7]|nr:hypothetical protein [Oscillatoria sp. SIO1A7]